MNAGILGLATRPRGPRGAECGGRARRHLGARIPQAFAASGSHRAAAPGRRIRRDRHRELGVASAV